MPAAMLLGDVLVGRFCRPAVRQRLALPWPCSPERRCWALAFRPPLAVAGAATILAALARRGQLTGRQGP